MIKTLFRAASLLLTPILNRHGIRLGARPVAHDQAELPMPPLWLRGEALIGWSPTNDDTPSKRRKLQLTWNLLRFGLDFDLNVGGHERGQDGWANLDLYLGAAAVALSYQGPVPAWWPVGQKSRRLAAGITGTGMIGWHLWLNPHTATPQDPRQRWRKFGRDVRDLVFGFERATDVTPSHRKPMVLEVPLPEGPVYVEMSRADILYQRPRWPFPVRRTFFRWATGEQGYKVGICDTTVRANGWAEAIGVLFESIIAKRGARSLTEHSKVGLCPTCKGTGANTTKRKACEDCSGSGKVSPEEAVRQASRSTAAHNGPVAGPDIKALARYAQQQNPLVRAQLLQIGAALALSAGRPGLAAEMAGELIDLAWGGSSAWSGLVDRAHQVIEWVARMDISDPRRPGCVLQPMPKNSGVKLEAVLDWNPADFMKLLNLSEQSAKTAYLAQTQTNALIRMITTQAERAGMPPGDLVPLYIHRLRLERTTLQSRIEIAGRLLQQLIAIGIPEGSAGDPMREILARAGEFLTALRAPIPTGEITLDALDHAAVPGSAHFPATPATTTPAGE